MERSSVLSALERFLIPAECLICERRIREPHDPVICTVCRARWKPVSPPWCRRCGQPRNRGISCTVCTGWPPGFETARSSYWLHEGPRAAVHALKYDGFERLGRELGTAMNRLAIPELDRSRIVLVPIPLGPARLRQRGYNQCESIARAVGHRWRVPVRPHLLRRVRDTQTQTALTPAARRANVAGAFAANGAHRQHTVVLVDDVLTTGATLAVAAATLLGAGVQRVHAITFGRARTRDFT